MYRLSHIVQMLDYYVGLFGIKGLINTAMVADILCLGVKKYGVETK